MESKTTKPYAKSVQSIINNLNSCSEDKYGARQTKFYLKRLRTLTGLPEQRIICELILAGLDVSKNSDIVACRERVKAEWRDEAGEQYAEG